MRKSCRQRKGKVFNPAELDVKSRRAENKNCSPRHGRLIGKLAVMSSRVKFPEQHPHIFVNVAVARNFRHQTRPIDAHLGRFSAFQSHSRDLLQFNLIISSN